MTQRRFPARHLAIVLSTILYGAMGGAIAKSEVKGAAILDHACGKVAVKQMGLVHAGKMEEANKLSTREMQDQRKAMPAKDKESSSTETTTQNYRIDGAQCLITR